MPSADKSIVIRDPDDGDAMALVAAMRPADFAEVTASHGPDVLATLRKALALSTHTVAIEDRRGRLLCLFGVMPLGLATGTGSPWMLGTDALDEFGRSLGLVARRYFDEVARVYPVLTNHVDARHEASIRLLEWLGCSFDEPEPYGVAGLPFLRFERRSD